MRSRWNARGTCWPTCLLPLLALAAPAAADITDIRGSVEVRLRETRFNAAGDSDESVEQFPETAADLPIVAVASLIASGQEIAAARAAAQFADPRDLNQPNPEEFAINLALNSVTPNTRYDVLARSEELRSIVFEPGDLGAGIGAGQTGTAAGRLFIDGALAIFSVEATRDLFGANVTLTVRVEKQTGDASQTLTETLFTGSIELNGAAAGNASVSAVGQFTTDTLILSDLSTVSDEYAAFHVLIIPNLELNYIYDAVIGEPFTLRATVEVEATNLERAVGIAALIGTPTDSLQEVIGATTGAAAASKFLAALQSERDQPTGRLVSELPPPLPPLCGLFGFEAFLLIGLSLTALRAARPFGLRVEPPSRAATVRERVLVRR